MAERICEENKQDLLESIKKLRLDNKEHTRPGWDTYFIRMAILAATRVVATRTNCMKRGVGAIVVRGLKIISTGYNGTPHGVSNCNEGGCPRCNHGGCQQGVGLDFCWCLHAEQNALLEAGRDRCSGATVYITCSPCIKCAVLIVQSGIKRVVYWEDYASSEATHDYMNQAGIEVEKFKKVCDCDDVITWIQKEHPQ
eukprot:GHVL01025001.1.p1 GENE.GHVL01025001.1~~GHVL01025001.1.p1  ORF type:complete len:197 (+),score=21.58 GHVL01025001.1:339-929(+)